VGQQDSCHGALLQWKKVNVQGRGSIAKGMRQRQAKFSVPTPPGQTPRFGDAARPTLPESAGRATYSGELQYLKKSGGTDEGEWRYEYLFKALRFSKSYYMAQLVAQKKNVTVADVDIADFKKVREVYNDLGPVHGLPFGDWRHNLKPHLFASSYDSTTRQLCKLDADVVLSDAEPRAKIDGGIETYITDRLRDRHPPASVIAIPIVGDKKRLWRSFKNTWIIYSAKLKKLLMPNTHLKFRAKHM
jgi:hypothetical protein